MFYLVTFFFSISTSFAASDIPQTRLRAMEARVIETVKNGETPVLVFDLDETLIDSTPRKYMAFREAVESICGDMNRPSGFGCEAATAIHQAQFYALENHYAVLDLFDSSTISSEWRATLDRTMTGIYLSGKGLELDREIPGAAKFVQKMRALGAKVYFVSSRSKNTQRQGTLESLWALGLGSPNIDQELVLKVDGVRSIDFKKATFAMIHKKPGHVVGVFENEPENMNAMVKEFSGALAYFIQGAWLLDLPVSEQAVILHDYYYF